MGGVCIRGSTIGCFKAKTRSNVRCRSLSNARVYSFRSCQDSFDRNLITLQESQDLSPHTTNIGKSSSSCISITPILSLPVQVAQKYKTLRVCNVFLVCVISIVATFFCPLFTDALAESVITSKVSIPQPAQGRILKGFVYGLILNANISADNLVSARRVLFQGKIAGLMSYIGSAIGETLCVSIPLLGLTSLAGSYWLREPLIHFAGGIFLFALGIGMFSDEFVRPVKMSERLSLISILLGQILIAFANPISLFSLHLLLYGNPVAPTLYSGSIQFIAGIFLGGVSWGVGSVYILQSIRDIFSSHYIQYERKSLLVTSRVIASIVIGLGLHATLGSSPAVLLGKL